MTHTFASPGARSPRSTRGAAFSDVHKHLQFSVAQEGPSRAFRLRDAMGRGLGRAGWISVGCAILVMSGLAAWIGSGDRAAADSSPVASQPAPVPVAEWVDINRPFPLYDVPGGDYAKLPMHYGARRETVGSARQDVLTYGLPKAGDPFLQVMFDRRPAAPRDATTLYVDTARLAGDAGLAVIRAAAPVALSTRFGSFEVSAVSIGETGRRADCLGFRRAASASSAKLQILGLACGDEDRPVDAAMLACTLNRIDLLSAGEDTDLQAMFAEAERRRGRNCDQGRRGYFVLKPDAAVRQVVGSLKGSIGPTADQAGATQKNIGRD